MVCFAGLNEQGWGFMQEAQWLVSAAEACCVLVLDTWAATCHVIIFQDVYQKAQAKFAQGWLKQECLLLSLL